MFTRPLGLPFHFKACGQNIDFYRSALQEPGRIPPLLTGHERGLIRIATGINWQFESIQTAVNIQNALLFPDLLGEQISGPPN